MGEVRHILATNDLTTDLVVAQMERAEELRNSGGEELRQSYNELRMRKVGGPSVYIAMFEDSTRTEGKHTLAANWLGLNPYNKNMARSSLNKGETKRDMIMNVVAQGFDAVVIRDRGVNTPEMAAEISEVPIINAGNGWDDHPTQALTDIYTVKREVGDVSDLTIAIVGDNYNGRVNRADARMFAKFGNKLVFVSIPGMEIRDDIRTELENASVKYHEVTSLLEATEFRPNAYVLSRLQEERFVGENPQTGEPWDLEKIKKGYYKNCRLNKKVLAAIRPDAKVLHPLPRGPEMPDDSDPRVVVWPQVKNGVWMAASGYEYVFKVGPFADAEAA